jgi:hypothetical protein
MILALLIAAAVLTVIVILAVVGDDPVGAVYIPSLALIIVVCVLAATAIQITEILA